LSDPGETRRWEPESREQRLRDIYERGSEILEMIRGLSLKELVADSMRLKAVTYDFQCLSEATTHLLRIDPSIVEKHPQVAWSQIRSVANAIRHEYGRIDANVLWNAATGDHLSGLLEVVRKELG